MQRRGGRGGRERVGVREREREREWEGGGETGRGGEVTLLTLGCGWWKGCTIYSLYLWECI